MLIKSKKKLSVFLNILIGFLLQTCIQADVRITTPVTIQNESSYSVEVFQVANGQAQTPITKSSTSDNPLIIPAKTAAKIELATGASYKYTLAATGTTPSYSPIMKSWIPGNQLVSNPYLLIKDPANVQNLFDPYGPLPTNN